MKLLYYTGTKRKLFILINKMKKLTPAEKLELSLTLYYNAKELKTAAIKKFYPHLTEEEVKEKVKKIFFYARS